MEYLGSKSLRRAALSMDVLCLAIPYLCRTNRMDSPCPGASIIVKTRIYFKHMRLSQNIVKERNWSKWVVDTYVKRLVKDAYKVAKTVLDDIVVKNKRAGLPTTETSLYSTRAPNV